MMESESPSSPAASLRWARLLRWGSAVLLVLAGVILSRTISLCQQELSHTGAEAVVEVCRPLRGDDPAVIGVLVLVALLLLPDLRELLLSRSLQLGERIEQTRSQQQELEMEIRHLRLELRVSQSQSQRQSIQVYTYGAAQAPLIASDVIKVEPMPAVATRSGPGGADPLTTLLALLREQAAYRNRHIPEALRLGESTAVRPVRVAVIGGVAEQGVFDTAALSEHLETPHLARRASRDLPIAGSIIGHVLAMAPSARILQLGVLEANGLLLNVESLGEAVGRALAWNPGILAIDLGGSEDIAAVSELLAEASQRTLIIAPAGNNRADISAWPARLPAVLSVASLNPEGGLAQFSNHGLSVDLAIDGVDVLCLAGVDPEGRLELGKMSGTTISSHLLTGIAAMLLAHTALPAGELRQLLQAAASPSAAAPNLRVVDALVAMERALGAA